jgi:predicted nucleotidyltransferase
MSSYYLANLLSSQELQSEDYEKLESHRTEVESFLREEFGEDPNNPAIKLAGSVKKGTAVKESYDLDLVVYFPSSDTRTLKEIHSDVMKKLLRRYEVELKSSALRIKSLDSAGFVHDYHIDVVPGRFISDPPKDTFLYINDPDRERLQTNLKRHIEYVTNSGCVEIIKLVKIWKKRSNVHLKTFVLELFVIDELSGYGHKDDLEKSFFKTMEGFRDNVNRLLIDPANSANIVSKIVSDADKSLAAGAARRTMDILNENSAEKWQLVFKETHPAKSFPTPTIITATPARPWNQ